MENLEDLLENELKDLYAAEKLLLDAIPEMQEAATHKKLKRLFGKHLQETEKHLERIQKICALLEINPGSTKCKMLQEVVYEGENCIKNIDNAEILDSALAACAKKMEHYEVAVYETAYRYAKELKMKKVKKLLRKNLEDELKAMQKLEKLARKKLIPNSLQSE